jgi:protein phosphatase
VVRPADAQRQAAKGVLIFVADGMGGHAAGEVASQMAAETVRRVYYEHDGSPPAALRQAFEQANRAVHAAAQDDEHLRGMGTTCTALAIRGAEAFTAHVGDSRLYRLHEGTLRQLSEDHSLVAEMLRGGLLTEEDARHHEDRNVITRALGLHATVDVSVSSTAMPVQAGDRFVLCSDGLYDLVEDHEIADAMREAPPHEASARLVDLANARGGYDNITVGVVRIDARPAATRPAAPDTRELDVLS